MEHPYALGPGPFTPGRFLRDTCALRLRFVRHPASPGRNFALRPSARFHDLLGPALSCIQLRRNAAPLFLVRSGTGFARLRPVTDPRRSRIADLVVPGDLIQVMPTSAVFLVYDRRGCADDDDDGEPVVHEIGDVEAALRPAGPVADDPLAALFPYLIAYLQSGRPWSILFNQPDGPPAQPMQWIASSSRSARRCAFGTCARAPVDPIVVIVRFQDCAPSIAAT